MTTEEAATAVLPADDAALEDPVASALALLQELIFRHPVAAQALFRSFVVEGREFARTEEGRLWAERLSRSDLVRQGRVAWDAVSLNALDDREETVFPTAILDAFAKAIASADLHAVLARALDQSIAGEAGHAG